MYAVASKSVIVAARPVTARRQARAQVKVVAEQKKEVAQRRAVFAGIAAAAAAAVLPKQAKADEDRSAALIAKLCAANPTSKACLENSANR